MIGLKDCVNFKNLLDVMSQGVVQRQDICCKKWQLIVVIVFIVVDRYLKISLIVICLVLLDY